MSKRKYQRWDKSQIRQHQLLVASVLLLTLTGMPLRYAPNPFAQKVALVIGGPTVAGILHRVGAAGLIIVLLWHCVYVLGRIRRQSMRWSTVPKVKDLTDAWHLALYLVGLRRHEPRYERYSFLEKFDYWAAFGGSCVMIATGLILWFPVLAAKIVGTTGIELSSAVHSLEAVLAAMFLLIGHVYHVHLAGGIKPFNMVWLTGQMTEEEMEMHHPLELEQLRNTEVESGTTGETDGSDEGETASAPTGDDRADRGGSAAGELRQGAGDDHPDGEPGPGEPPGNGA